MKICSIIVISILIAFVVQNVKGASWLKRKDTNVQINAQQYENVSSESLKPSVKAIAFVMLAINVVSAESRQLLDSTKYAASTSTFVAPAQAPTQVDGIKTLDHAEAVLSEVRKHLSWIFPFLMVCSILLYAYKILVRPGAAPQQPQQIQLAPVRRERMHQVRPVNE